MPKDTLYGNLRRKGKHTAVQAGFPQKLYSVQTRRFEAHEQPTITVALGACVAAVPAGRFARLAFGPLIYADGPLNTSIAIRAPATSLLGFSVVISRRSAGRAC